MNGADAWQARSRGILLRATAVADASAAGVSGPRFEAGDLRLRLPTELRPLSRPSCRKRGESVSVSRQLFHSSWREKSCTCLLSGPQNQASATVAVSYLLQLCYVTRLTSAWGCASGGERRAYVGCCESIGGASDIIACVALSAGGAGFIAEHRIVGRDAGLAA